MNACCIGCSSPSVASPSIVTMSAPSACTASIVQLFTDSPSTWTVHAPHDDVSQPTFVPVRLELLAEELHEQRAWLDVAAASGAVDRE